MNVRLLALFGGLLWIAVYIVYIFSNTMILLVLAVSVALMGLSVLRLLQSPQIVTAARIGGWVLISGMGLIVLGGAITGAGGPGAVFLLVIAGELITTLGLVAFSLALLGSGPASFWKVLPLLMAPVYFISWGLNPGGFPAWVPENIENWMAVVYGAGWVLLGFLLPKESPGGTVVESQPSEAG